MLLSMRSYNLAVVVMLVLLTQFGKAAEKCTKDTCGATDAGGKQKEAKKEVPGKPIKFMAIGDWGAEVPDDQVAVAKMMAKWADKNGADFIVTVGDNFYPYGVHSVADPQFDQKWRYVYSQSSIKDLTWYISVGNHDYPQQSEWFQVGYSKVEKRWHFPHLWYSFTKQIGGATAHFVVLDTEGLMEHENNPEKQLKWFEEEMKSNSKADWKIVIGHRPLYNAGYYVPMNRMVYKKIRPLLMKHKVDFYISGHDHNLQHLRDENATDFIISGGGGAPLYQPNAANINELRNMGVTTEFMKITHGFVALAIDHKRAVVEYIDKEGKMVHGFERLRRKN